MINKHIHDFFAGLIAVQINNIMNGKTSEPLSSKQLQQLKEISNLTSTNNRESFKQVVNSVRDYEKAIIVFYLIYEKGLGTDFHLLLAYHFCNKSINLRNTNHDLARAFRVRILINHYEKLARFISFALMNSGNGTKQTFDFMLMTDLYSLPDSYPDPFILRKKRLISTNRANYPDRTLTDINRIGEQGHQELTNLINNVLNLS